MQGDQLEGCWKKIQVRCDRGLNKDSDSRNNEEDLWVRGNSKKDYNSILWLIECDY